MSQLHPVVTDSRPLSQQLAQQIRDLIRDGALPAGAQLPSEALFAERFRVGRTTVREALKELESEGAVVVRRGRGRFISSAPVLRRPITRLESVTEMLASHGYDVTNRVLAVEARPASEAERSRLLLEADGEVLELSRLRLHGDDPLIYSVDVLPRTLFGELDMIDWGGSLLELLGERGLGPVRSIATIRAAHVRPEVAETCGLDASSPFLLMVQLNLTEAGQPILYSHDYHRGDRFSFDLVRRVQSRGPS